MSVVRGGSWGDALRIVYHSQIQAWTFMEIILPKKLSSGTRIGEEPEGLFINFR